MLLPPPSKPAAAPSSLLSLLILSYKEFVITFGPPKITSLSPDLSLNYTQCSKFLLPSKVTYSQGSRRRHLWEAVLLPSTEGKEQDWAEKLNCDVDATETSAKPTESRNLVCSSKVSQIEARSQAFVHPKLTTQ